MSMTIKVALAGAGAFGIKHLDGIKNIDGVEVVSLISRDLDKTKESGRQVRHRPRHHQTRRQPGAQGSGRRHPVHAHADARRADPGLPEGGQARAGRDSAGRQPQGREEVVALQKQTGLVAMCGHTRRFNPSHQYVNKKITAGEFNIQQMDVQTYFFRRTNMNALGQATQLDRPPAVAPRRPHRGPVRLPVRQPHRARPMPCRARSTRRWALRWT